MSDWARTHLFGTPVQPAKPSSFMLPALFLAFSNPLIGLVLAHLGLCDVKVRGTRGASVLLAAIIVAYAGVVAKVALIVTGTPESLLW